MNPLRLSFHAAIIPIAVLAPFVLSAQVQSQGTATGAGTLNPSSSNAAAVAAVRSALDDYFNLRQKSAVAHTTRALQLDPALGIARTLRAVAVGGPTAADESREGASDAAAGSAGEAALALAVREQVAGRNEAARQLFAAASALLPNDPAVALWRAWALTDTARISALRDVSARFPDYAPARMFLAFYLIPLGNDSVVAANGDEALRVTAEVVRLAPQSSAAHANFAHVLIGLRRFAEARQHLQAATRLEPKDPYAYQLLAQLATFDNDMPAMRAALDSALAWTVNVNSIFNYRRARAMIHLAEGDAPRAQAELVDIARMAEAMGARPNAALTYMFAAAAASAARDTAAVERHLAAARTLNPAAATLADYEITAYALSGQAAKARASLDTWLRATAPQPNANEAPVRREARHRHTGLVLLAEGKAREAIAELRQGGTNPYADLARIEAYRQLGDRRQADAARAAFFERKTFSYVSSATPLIRYRARK